MGGAGQLTPSWQGIADGGKAFATVGPLLLEASPAVLPKDARISCGKYTSPNRFYEGEAIRLFALKTPKGHLLLAVNQNPDGVEAGTVQLPAGANFNLTALSVLKGRQLNIRLNPGDAVYLYN